jgi:hypothetical protein
VVPLDYDIVVSNASLGRYLHFVVAIQQLLPPIDIRELQRRQSFLLIILQIIISKIKGNFGGGVMVLNATFNNIFQLYRGGQFYWWRKPEYVEKTTDLP